MEIVSAKNIKRQLGSDNITVGQEVSIEHTWMVKMGERVEIISTIEKREKRGVYFSINATANGKTIATATHKRIVIPTKIIDKVLKS